MKPMIITRIQGGLGNQMFQYAAGYVLAKHTTADLCWDLSHYHRDRGSRELALNRVFGLEVSHANPAEFKLVLGWRGNQIARGILHRPEFSGLRSRHHRQEPHAKYWEKFWSLRGNIYLDGYWQSEKYFLEYSSLIHAAFAFKAKLNDANERLADMILSHNSVSVHVRRGDYVYNSHTNRFHGVCSLEYFERAIQAVASCIPDVRFFVFSDDPAWTQNNIRGPYAFTHVTHNVGADSHIDMQLMSYCKHHIISNSSFSWWGAWLNRQQNKIVISPRYWFTDVLTENTGIPCAEWIYV